MKKSRETGTKGLKKQRESRGALRTILSTVLDLGNARRERLIDEEGPRVGV